MLSKINLEKRKSVPMFGSRSNYNFLTQCPKSRNYTPDESLRNSSYRALRVMIASQRPGVSPLLMRSNQISTTFKANLSTLESARNARNASQAYALIFQILDAGNIDRIVEIFEELVQDFNCNTDDLTSEFRKEAAYTHNQIRTLLNGIKLIAFKNELEAVNLTINLN